MIIVAGGSGTRMGADLPKQFIELNGLPILMHTLQHLHEMDATMQLVLVLPESQMDFWEQLCCKHNWRVPHLLANGGATRFLSVQSGLALAQGKLVGVHDGVRPFVSRDVVQACFKAAESNGAAIPVVPIIQSLRRLENGESKAADRNEYRAVQTPQCFRTELLKKAFASAEHTDYSDDATVVEASGHPISMVEGNNENIKITSPIDLELGQLIIARRKN